MSVALFIFRIQTQKGKEALALRISSQSVKLRHTHSIILNPGLVSVDYESGCAEVWCDDAGLISFVRVSLSSDLAASLPRLLRVPGPQLGVSQWVHWHRRVS